MLDRPKSLPSVTRKLPTSCGEITVIITFNEGKVFEVFSYGKNAGDCMGAFGAALTRSITAGLRRGVPVEVYVEQLKDIQCPNSEWLDGNLVRSCPDAISKALEEFKDGAATKVGKICKLEVVEKGD